MPGLILTSTDRASSSTIAPNAAGNPTAGRKPPAQLQRDFWAAHRVPQPSSVFLEEAAPLLGSVLLTKKNIESKVRQAIVKLNPALKSGTFTPSDKQLEKLAAIDHGNVMQLWLTSKKPAALPAQERHALFAVICAAGQPGLELLWGEQEILMSTFRARCALIENNSWQACAALRPKLRQLLAVLWAMGQGADISLHYTDASSRAYCKAVIQPLLAVVAAEGLESLPVATRILASSRGALNRHGAWVSSLELSCQDPENFLPESPLASLPKSYAELSVPLAPEDPNSALDCLTLGSHPIRRTTPASVQPVPPLPAPREASRPACAASPPQTTGLALAGTSPLAPQSIAAEPIEHSFVINGQHVRMSAAMLQALAFNMP